MMHGTRMQSVSSDWLPVDRFGDGPPRWTIGAGKSWQRPSQTLGEAMAQRDKAVRKLKWHSRSKNRRLREARMQAVVVFFCLEVS
jgi:hypothetical protein